MPYLLFLKKQQNLKCRLLQVIGSALRVKTLSIPMAPKYKDGQWYNGYYIVTL